MTQLKLWKTWIKNSLPYNDHGSQNEKFPGENFIKRFTENMAYLTGKPLLIEPEIA